ncbi:MAG: hypothetical protein ACI92S_001692 [Planctomycetaceae bacterium]|jgi:hypothetical protein
MRLNYSAIQYSILCTSIAAVSFLSGCNADYLDSGETQQSESQAQPESQFDIRESDWLSITDDDDALKKAQARALIVNQNDGKPNDLVNAVEANDDPESVENMNQRKETIEKLVQALTADDFTDTSIRAASQLCHLGEVSGRDYAVQVLREGTPKQRGQILYGIQHRTSEWSDRVREKHEKFLFEDDLLVTAMLQQLDPKEMMSDV